MRKAARGGSLPGSFHGRPSLGKVKPLNTIDALNDIVLTFQYAENLENMSIVRAAGQAAARARARSNVSRVGTNRLMCSKQRTTSNTYEKNIYVHFS